MVWLDPTNAAETAMLGKFLALLPPDAPYMGWRTSEPDGVQQTSNDMARGCQIPGKTAVFGHFD